MSTHRRRRLRRGAAEQLLRGGPAGPLAHGDALVGLLAAAAAPAHSRELAGEEQAVTAFRVATLTPATQPRRPSMIKTGMAKLLTLKLALAAGVVAAGGGLALAASTGNLSSLPGGAESPPAAHSSVANAAPGTAANATHKPSATPSPSLRGLCRAYTAGVSTSAGKALDNPAFTALITAAGGKDNVATFCASLAGTASSHGPSAHPTAGPNSHPTGKPTDLPTGAPASHPTGKPTSLPAQ